MDSKNLLEVGGGNSIGSINSRSSSSSSSSNSESPRSDSSSCVKENQVVPSSRQRMLLDKSPSYHEEYDEYGDVVKVGNLHFTNKVLGSGAYAQVVLAKRITTHTNTTSSSSSSSSSIEHHDYSSNVSSTRPFFRSVSLRRGSFNRNIKISSSMGNTSSKTTCSECDPNTVNKDDYVAVKIYSKSLLKRMRNIKCSISTSTPKKRIMEVHTALENVEREIALMKQMRHPNLVSLLQVIDSVDSDALYVVLEFVPLGEIMTFDPETQRFRHRHVNTPGLTKGGYFREEYAALFFVDVLHGLAYLHRNCICHRDLKPENILMTQQGVAKISDFGVSHFFEEERDRLSSVRSTMSSFNQDDISVSTMDYSEEVHTRPTKLTRYDTDSALEMDNLSTSGILRTTEGTYPFWSPEMCNGNASFSGYASDLWAAGICLYIFASGRLPFYSDSPSQLFHMISKGKVPFVHHHHHHNNNHNHNTSIHFSPDLQDLLSKVLHKDPSARAGVGDCLKHKFCTQARIQRMNMLGENIRHSTETTITVNSQDKHRAFSIARVAKAAHNQMTQRFQLAREIFASTKPHISHTFSTLSSSSSWIDFAAERKKRFMKSISTMSGGAAAATGGGGVDDDKVTTSHKKSSSPSPSLSHVTHKPTSASTTGATLVEDIDNDNHNNNNNNKNKEEQDDAFSRTTSDSSRTSKCLVM